MALRDVIDDLGKARKRLKMIDLALFHYLQEAADPKDPIEGILFEIGDIFSLLEESYESAKEEKVYAEDLKERLEDRSEKLNRVADQKEHFKELSRERQATLYEVLSIVGGDRRYEFETDSEACAEAATLLLNRDPNAETFYRHRRLLQEVYGRAKDVVDAEMPVDTMDELAEAVEQYQKFFSDTDA